MNQGKIGKLISEKRKLKGLTQVELGQKLGVGGKAVSKWETGLTFPDISILKNLSKELNIDLDLLLDSNVTNLKPKKLKKNKFIKKIVVIIVLIIVSIIGLTIMFSNNRDNILQISNKNDIISFKGYILETNNGKVININDFKLLDNSFDFPVMEYKLILKNSDDVLGGCYYSSEDNSPKILSELLKTAIIDINDIDNEYKINLEKLNLTLEYTNLENEIKYINLNMNID